MCFPPDLRKKYFDAFISEGYNKSCFQNDVVSELRAIGLKPDEDVLAQSGYRLDALVKVNGKSIPIEVDGPSHFIGRDPTGSTILKRRQVTNLDGMTIVSVPNWYWQKLGRSRSKKQQYLQSLLGLSTGNSTVP